MTWFEARVCRVKVGYDQVVQHCISQELQPLVIEGKRLKTQLGCLIHYTEEDIYIHINIYKYREKGRAVT